jgi:hypothetical protein
LYLAWPNLAEMLFRYCRAPGPVRQRDYFLALTLAHALSQGVCRIHLMGSMPGKRNFLDDFDVAGKGLGTIIAVPGDPVIGFLWHRKRTKNNA